MQKQLLSTFLFVTIFSFLTLTGCKKEDSSPTASSPTVTYLTTAEIEAESNPAKWGGDPRGTYTANIPYVHYISGSTDINLVYKSQIKNESSGSIKYEGTSATSGTVTTTNLSTNINLVMTIKQSSGDVDTTITESISNVSVSGTWEVIAGNKFVVTVNGNSDTSYYAATSKGIFFLQESPSFSNVYGVTVYKK